MADYVRNIEPGAYGTYKELERIGAYGKNASAKDKVIGFALENKNGSPLWSRTLDKQIKKGTASINKVVDISDETGKVIKSIDFDKFDKSKLKKGHSVNVKNKISGKGKVGRALGIAGDIALGGITGSALFALPALATKPFNKDDNDKKSDNKKEKPDYEKKEKPLKRGGKDLSTNSLKSNSAVNPVY